MNRVVRPDLDGVDWEACPNLDVIFARDEFHALRSYWNTVEGQIEALTANSVKVIDERCRAEGLTEAEVSRVRSTWADILNDREITWWEVLQSAFLMKVCSWLEGSVAVECRGIEYDARIPKTVRWAEVRHRGLQKARVYLRTNFDLDLARHRQWVRLQRFNRIRNCVVHCGGRVSVDSDPKNLVEAVRQTKGVSVSHDEIFFDDESLDLLFASVDEFWEDFQVALVMNNVVGPARSRN